MDSGNSGSMQSSSGGDEEYDVSRSDQPLAAFVSPNAGNTPADFTASLGLHQQRRQNLSPPSTFFDSLPSYVDAFIRSPPAAPNTGHLLSLDMSWPAAEQTCADIAGSLVGRSSNRPVPPPPSSETPTSNLTLQSVVAGTNSLATTSDQTPAATPRPSKKRPRASRRAPTTVLTTDTSNFRQMVQEFTGIPAPPFSSGAFPRARFDLFNTASAPSFRSLPETSGLLGPFAQKLSIPTPALTPNLSFGPFAASSCSSSSSAASGVVATTVAPSATTTNPCTTSINSMTTATAASGPATTVCVDPNTTGNYQLPAGLDGVTNQIQSGLMQSQLLAYQSLFRSAQQPTSPSQGYNLSSVFGSKTPAPTMSSTPRATGGRDEYGFSSGDMISSGDTLTRLLGSERVTSRGGGGGDDLLRWGEGPGLAGAGAGAGAGGDQTRFRPSGGHYGSSSVNNSCKMNHSARLTSEFHSENRSDIVNSSRGEGTFDPWICSSDEERHYFR